MLKVRGVQDTIAKLARFDKKLRRSEMRRAGNEGSKIALNALKQFAPKRTGTWRKSLGRKVQVKDGGLRLWYGAGPRSSVFAMVTFNPGIKTIEIRGAVRTREGVKDRGEARQRKVKGGFGGRVAILKKSKRGPDGQPALFWRDKSGKVRAMPLKRKFWPVLYSHLIERGTRQGTRAYRMLARAQAASRQAQQEAVVRVLSAAVREV